ncbi:MAG: undecaprenyl diphosphate synthase [Bacillota bacterium]|nr:undecaprenyl diphosphate synthase [Bacillota bacterium]MDK2855520.1 undecaprenyl diphosphate synthase [Bacillota bacterium]MDK2925012.1 undecaprenyl diphosphate synthase [Bacillota bacterium]
MQGVNSLKQGERQEMVVQEAGPRPEHVAIIMDGNGRWAQARGLPRIMGHRAGMEAVRRVVQSAPGLGIKYLTLFAFSTENWRRPRLEVEGLFALLREYVEKETSDLKAQGVRVRFLGERENLPQAAKKVIERCEAETAGCTRLMLNIALNYGGRAEIVRAARALASRAAAGQLEPDAITAEVLAAELYTRGMPDPDLLIRTSGEMRLSNFLLWQLAYTELYFTDVLWPDFTQDDLAQALAAYRKRERRFGGIQNRG